MGRLMVPEPMPRTVTRQTAIVRFETGFRIFAAGGSETAAFNAVREPPMNY
jgi:hypothetical protein